MQDIHNILRQYNTEGATHLYSSPPSVLTPADLYRAKHDAHYRDLITGSNIYLITARRRVLINPLDICLMGRSAHGSFLVMDEYGVQSVPFRYDIAPINADDDEEIEQVLVAPNGTHLFVMTASRKQTVAAHVVVSQAASALEADHRDMQVLYVGQGIGKVHARTAVDRLLNHTTLQRILAEASTNSPELEISLLLYRFEHGRTVISNGGDFNVDPRATEEEETAHFERLRGVRLNRNEVISLAEAALINHFKPHYNTQLKSTNFAASQKIVALKKLLAKGITGLTVEISTANLNARLGTPAALPMDLEQVLPDYALEGIYLDTDQQKQAWAEQLHLMAHTHLASFALTTPQERETFMHGMVWLGETEREQLWPLHGKFE
ncbi:hypothetical protein [Pseudomonas poae]|uniref:Uncharacterized protein n=1 Tax=Pseudomonas poae TaxID=200451 RepID=A0A2S9DV01_9PSED|nr:hypothetical protein [Pseudomonas poae]PRA21882.1 hypothetical protein CQZ97_27380 [Pseudomonas poae]PRC06411.1 hypothetical protein CQZ99_28870 [Pseudomonas poae]